MDIQSLEKMIETGRDSAMLRLTLAGALQQQGALSPALEHLQSAIKQDPDYTAAWKALGRVHLELDDNDSARKAWQQGIAVAEKRGDKQAQKEMQVFLKRLDKAAAHRQK
jgi:Tfp pilus assembly protein PilF